jgi:protein TonB
MRRDIFGDLVNPPVAVRGKSLIAVAAAMMVEVVAIAAMIVVPLMIVGVVPKPPSMMAFVKPPEPPPLPPPPTAQRREKQSIVETNAAPIDTPTEIRAESLRGGFESDVDVPIDVATGSVPEPPPRIPAPPEVPVRIGGAIHPPQKTKDASPVYPPIAQLAHMEGIVIIEAVIGADGTVKDAKVLRSIPLLDQAALDAVRQWQFTPTLLNGQPVPVIMTVTVQFALR